MDLNKRFTKTKRPCTGGFRPFLERCERAAGYGPLPGALVAAGPMPLRIDVHHGNDDIERELAVLEGRAAGGSLHALETLPIGHPGLVFRHRVADGEHYVYAVDAASGRLAGYTVFNRLVEIDRRADRYLRAPHSKYAAPWQRRGIATAVYQWWLAAGNCLISGARQSPGANALWLSLAREHQLACVSLEARKLAWLPADMAAPVREALGTRMILFGRSWDRTRFAAAAGVLPVREAPVAPDGWWRRAVRRLDR